MIGLAPGALIVLVAALFACVWSYDARFVDGQRVDAVIVLGAAIKRDQPSPVLAARLDYAHDLLRSGRARYAILTGGVGQGKRWSEGDVERMYLEQRGLRSRDLLVERRSTTTQENLCEALKLGQQRGLRSYAIVSDQLHLRRAMQLARDIGLDALPAATPYTKYRGLSVRLKFALRETYFLAGRWLTGQKSC